MSTYASPRERYHQRMMDMKKAAGPGYGKFPEQEPDPEDEKFSLKKFLHQIYCMLTGKNQDQDKR